MSALEQFYGSVGGDVQEVVKRLGVPEDFILVVLKKFYDDGSFERLVQALDAGATEDAFHAAHALKGVCANLGFDTIFVYASDMTELLRSGALEDARAALPSLKKQYDSLLSALDTLFCA